LKPPEEKEPKVELVMADARTSRIAIHLETRFDRLLALKRADYG
jgi:hypothetical protein